MTARTASRRPRNVRTFPLRRRRRRLRHPAWKCHRNLGTFSMVRRLATGHCSLHWPLTTGYWPLFPSHSPLATRHSLLVLYLLRSMACESNVLVALDAVHGQLDVGQGRAVDVALFGSLDEIVGVALEFRGQGHVIGGVGNHRNFPLGRLAQNLQRLGVLLDHGILLERQPFEDILGEFELPPHEFAAALLLLLARPAC